MSQPDKMYADINARPGYQRIMLIALFVIVIALIVVIAMMVNNLFSLKSQNSNQETRINQLVNDSLQFQNQLVKMRDNEIALNQQLEELLQERERIINSRDSVARLLAYSRANERNARAKITQLQKQLKSLQSKLDQVQSQYDELLAQNTGNSEELQLQIEALTNERNALAEENQRLQRELLAATGNADNRTAIFATSMAAVPGEVKRGKFSASRRSRNTDRVEVSFALSRPPQPTENLIFKVFNGKSQEIPIKPRYRNELNAPADPSRQKVTLEFEGGKLDRRADGIYTVRLYLTDVNKGLENQEIGISRFELK